MSNRSGVDDGVGPDRKLTSLVFALVILFSLFVLPVGQADGEEHANDIRRDGSTLIIELAEDEFPGNDTTIRVEIEGTEFQYNDRTVDDGIYRYSVPFTELGFQGETLENASVRVYAGGNENASITETLDLRYVGLASPDRDSFAEGVLHIPVETSFGVSGDSNLRVSVSGPEGSTTLSQSIQGGSVAIDVVTLRDDVGLSDQVTVEVVTATGRSLGNSLSIDIIDLGRRATTVTRAAGGLYVSGPFVFDGTTYLVTASTERGQYVRELSADQDGILIESGALLTAEDGTITVERDGTVWAEGPLPAGNDGIPEINAEAINATAINVSYPKTIEWVWIDDSDRNIVLNSSEFATGSPDDTNWQHVVFLSDSHAMDPGKMYSLVFASEDGELRQAEVDFDEGGSASGGGLLDRVTGALSEVSLQHFILGIIIVGLVLVVLALLYFAFGSPSSTPASTAQGGRHRGGRRTTAVATAQVTVEARDKMTGEVVDRAITVTAEGYSGASSRKVQSTETLVDGRASFKLSEGTWTLIYEDSTGSKERRQIRIRSDQPRTVPLELEPNEVRFTATDAQTGEMIPDVNVDCSTGTGHDVQIRLDGNGRGVVRMPRIVDEVRLTVAHDAYETVQKTVPATAGGVEIELPPRTGRLRAVVTIDGRPTADVPVTLSGGPFDDAGESAKGMTDQEGAVVFDDLRVGEYRVVPDLEERTFVNSSENVRVSHDETTEVTIDTSFGYSLSSEQRNRIASIRSEVDDLTASSGLDLAIQRYFASVVSQLLDTIERLPSQGHRFATTDVEPDRLTDTLLDATEGTVDCISDALTTPRNMDLFVATSDMPDTYVEWDGQYDYDELFDGLRSEPVEHRRKLADRLREVSDRIETAESDLATIAPARETWNRVRDFARSERGEDPVRSVTIVFVVEGVLSAIEGLFEQPDLRKRLEQTVF